MMDILIFVRNLILFAILAILGIQAGGDDTSNEQESTSKSPISALL